MNGNIVNRIDEMSKKIDELEGSIGELVKEAQEEPEAGAAIQWLTSDDSRKLKGSTYE